MSLAERVVAFPAADGYVLAGSVFEPEGPLTLTPVVILSATGVKRRFYADFASFLATQGFPVLTLDYRGIGGSRRGSLRSLTSRMQDWAELDAAAGLDAATAHWYSDHVLVVGHSFGGQALGLLPRPERIRGALLVGAQSGYWGHWPAATRVGMCLFWYLAIPVLTRLVGYFPSRFFGMGEDLPPGVARQWASWGRRPRYLLDGIPDAAARFAQVTAKIRSVSISDDRFAPKAAVDALAAFYTGSPVQRVHLTPRGLGASRVGHFGFFREPLLKPAWNDAAHFLLSVCS